MRRRVAVERAQGGRASGAALIEDDDAVILRIEEAAMRRRRTGPGAAMQEDDRFAIGVARLLPIHRMHGIEPQHAAGIGLDGREEILAGKRRVTVHRWQSKTRLFLGNPARCRGTIMMAAKALRLALMPPELHAEDRMMLPLLAPDAALFLDIDGTLIDFV